MSERQFLFLHGWGYSEDIWDEFLGQLQLEHDPIYVDWTYIGNPADFLLRAETALRACIETGREVTIVGWSLGSIVAQQLASKYEDKVTELILLAPTASFIKRGPQSRGWHERVLKMMQQRLQLDTEATLTDFVKLILTAEEAEFTHKFPLASTTDLRSLHMGLDYLIATDVRDAFPDLKQDILVIHGEKDEVCPVGNLPSMNRDEALYYEEYRLPNVGHAPFITSLPEVVQKVEQFLERSG